MAFPAMQYTTSQWTTRPLAYRDADNSTVRYLSPAAQNPVQLYNAYDSDMEPLVNTVDSFVGDDDLQRFTATGRPMPYYRPRTGVNDMYAMPELLPKRYTDESIIPAIIIDVIPTPPSAQEGEGVDVGAKEKTRRPSFLQKLKHEKPKPQPSVITKVVFMPRGEYLRFFARDNSGNYIGSEPYKQWTEKELNDRYGKFKPNFKREKKGWVNFVFS
ncbi:hypothetical protein BP5796_11770 [Coleophoma crateriformis]|uniref:Uncharacterized protein n=1 Tax=Coleophoma crateriformis TaxID=565419 RepID=A0A3D8QFG8_9HELO|nr:hypothetical protein BP5796_11770 [Coleophoma crateriformis]